MPTTAPTLTPVVGVPSTIPASQLGTLTGVAVYDGPYNGGPTGLGLGTIAFKWDTGSSGWVTLDTSPVALTLPVARGDILGSTQPHGWLLVDLSWADISGQRQTKRLQFRPQAGPGQVFDLTADQAPIAYTTPQSLIDLMNNAQAAGNSATAAAGVATSAAGTATAAAAAANTQTASAVAAIQAANTALAAAAALELSTANIKLYATTAERTADAAPNGTWGRALSDNSLARREAGAWVVRGSLGGPLILTRAQRQALAPLVFTQVNESDTHLAVSYTPGLGWTRDGDGGNPDAAPPPPDSGSYP